MLSHKRFLMTGTFLDRADRVLEMRLFDRENGFWNADSAAAVANIWSMMP